MLYKALRRAAVNGRTEVVELLLETEVNEQRFKDDALCEAASFGRTETVELLIKAGANPHCVLDDWLILYCIKKRGYTEVIKLLQNVAK